ncbi:DNA ligase (NAD(+)) (EC [Olavius algarvensis associated proteobacterium Delta 3]|nr:DNA ligase (NAD(+)) (EC [Olavius algarvensis associated proteobacterium Delta 3]CAB5139146.1 DNA ligase (NAD(+)) (EC [Olavius algarvensis associated proteobacterium Delta 3]
MEDIKKLVEKLNAYNDAYRRGKPLISDVEYDALVEQLREIAPQHPFLNAVEPETFENKIEIRHPAPMLSTEKAYTEEQLSRFVSRVMKAAGDIGVLDVRFRVTPKLDGLAGRDDGTIFASRGNGEVGYEISSAFQKGVIPVGGRGLGIGEIVIEMSYFEEHLAEEFEHPRNMVVGIVASDTLNEYARRAIEDGKVHFVPYSQLVSWEGSATALLENTEDIIQELTKQVDYPIDGVVAEVINEDVKTYMGATSHHYRWQIAIKSKGETAETTVRSVMWQVGRTGSITPVMEVEPVLLSGANIRRVTAHHAGLIRKEGIGEGARIEIIRSGEVIPKLEQILEKSRHIVIPGHCPSCSTPLLWQNDFLKCTNDNCPAQIEQRISHWFKTLGNADWFGIKTIRRLVESGIDTLEKVYAMKESDFSELGFGPVQSGNLYNALQTSRTKPVEDWRFLAAFGVSDLGKGDSRKLLARIPLENLPDSTPEQIEAIDGFGKITSRSITRGLNGIRRTFDNMMDLGFRIEKTPLLADVQSLDTPITGKSIVFTGKMTRGSREAMQAGARKLGAKVQSGVSGKTDFLVCGEKVGPSKIEKATRLGVTIMSEADYFEMISEPDG